MCTRGISCVQGTSVYEDEDGIPIRTGKVEFGDVEIYSSIQLIIGNNFIHIISANHSQPKDHYCSYPT